MSRTCSLAASRMHRHLINNPFGLPSCKHQRHSLNKFLCSDRKLGAPKFSTCRSLKSTLDTSAKNLQQLVAESDDFPHLGTLQHTIALTDCWYLTHIANATVHTVSYLTPSVATALLSVPASVRDTIYIDSSARIISIQADNVDRRSNTLASIIDHWRTHSTFPMLEHLRGEQMAIYSPSGSIYANIDRNCVPVFGFVAYYVYLIAYTHHRGADGQRELRIWIQQRSSSKTWHGGMLDCTVAGAIQAGQTPDESILRESKEEASLPLSVLAGAKPILPGSNRLVNMRQVDGFFRPACGFGYELELKAGEEPVPSDGEVEAFQAISVEDVKRKLKDREFMPNAAKVLVEWLGRKGQIAEEDISLEQRKIVFPLM
ncbi:NUDIX hydrolase domain-like protein [Calycina marina]|uniref:NUDIX hydrolase domain-like protein n=1 Tax=Calycina marina TaxID=1763456 RepID=A0A9P8CDZ3_9HELO|nr:NUDIX hydrolase domain-like protein [Calycina marina]